MAVPVAIRQPAGGDVMESVLLKGDLGKLTPEERAHYCEAVCRSMGLNPLTRPFEYITLNGKLTLYATRGCADQLRKINNISLEVVSEKIEDEVLSVRVRARMSDGRTDEDLGAVPFAATLHGEARSNQWLKCVTKAKRRVTLSICGLGFLDETEVETIPAAAKRPALHAPATSEVSITDLDGELATAAEQGMRALEEAWDVIPADAKKTLKAALERRHKPAAVKADNDRMKEQTT
jgi:hypothetical protein